MAKRASRRQLSFSEGTEGESRRCKLCQSHHSQLSSPAEWKDEQARAYALSLQVSLESLVCHPCRRDIPRANPKHVPRWRKQGISSDKNRDTHECYVADCRERAFVSTTLGNSTQMKNAFNSMGLSCSEVIPTPTPLCQYHYHLIYDVLKGVQRQCVTCGTWLKFTSHRPCINPDAIQEYLKEHTGFEGQILSHDRVCLTCSKSHLVILQEHNPPSKDSDLRQLLDSYSQQIPSTDQITTENVIK